METTREKFDPQSQKTKRRHYPLWVCLGAFLIVLVGLISLAFSYMSYTMVKKTTESATQQLAEEIGDITELTVLTTQQQTYRLLDMLSQSRLAQARSLDERMPSLPYLAIILLQNPDIHAISTGYENGDFFYVKTLSMGAPKLKLDIPEKTFFWVNSIENTSEGKKLAVLFFDKEMRLLSRIAVDDDLYDPRTRTWYEQALQSTGAISTAPYLYFHSNEAGVTFAHVSTKGDSVVAIDTSLSFLSERLKTLLPTPFSRIALFKPDGSLVAYLRGMAQPLTGNSKENGLFSLSHEDARVLLEAREEYANGKRGMTKAVSIDGEEWFLFLRDLTDDNKEGNNVLLLAMPVAEIMEGAETLLNSTLKLALFTLLMSLPIAWLMAQYAVKPVHLLVKQAKRILEFRFDDAINVSSSVKELDILAHTIARLKENIMRFLTINQNISTERNFEKLLETILGEILNVANADGGMIGLLDEKGQYQPDIRMKWKRLNDETQSLVLPEGLKEMLPHDKDFCSGKTVHAIISRDDPLAALAVFAPAFDNAKIISLSIIHIPLRNSTGYCLGTLSLLMSMKSSQENFEYQQIAFSEVLASTAAIALENHRLLEAHDKLLDALVKIIAGAIDAKSPYTGGHCQRVPVIFDLLLNAACDVSEGPFKDFTLTEEERREAHLAAWLHDCGKVTTPEYVVDKATKLETIYDRIHEVRMRFEVLKRDAEITCLRKFLQNGMSEERKEQLAEELSNSLETLDQEYAFVAQCNIGGEFLDASAIERLQQIAKRSWLRTMDNRLGVSRAESLRIGDVVISLPVREQLLSDKPEHIIERDPATFENPEISRFGFKMEAPLHLYNRGEIHNLRVSRGTLSNEERFKINEHITETIIMLNNLPLPKHLKGIPEIACNHHETLDGKGYPRRLTLTDLNIKSRMMAIADIFEALTAGDRPYKSRKTLSEALKIMDGFRDRNQIDAELYALFIKSGVAKIYAAQYLHSDQYDI